MKTIEEKAKTYDGVLKPIKERVPDVITIHPCGTLWNIQDTKVGDVLEFTDHGKSVIGIVSYVNKRTEKVDVCCLLEDDLFKVGNYYALDTINPHPATREQCDLLFKKMHEADYDWDANKLQLKAIERESAEYPLCKTIKEKIDYYIANHFVTDTVVKTDVASIVRAMEEGVRIGINEGKSV